MSEVNFRPILLMGEATTKVDDLARQYVEKFNEVGGFVIEKYKARNPTDEEVAHAKKTIMVGLRVEKTGNDWFTVAPVNNMLTKVRLFVVEVTQHRRLPKDIEDMKLEKAKATIKLTNPTNK